MLAELIQQGQVWRAQDAPARPAQPLLPTGYPELDQCLAGGWMPGQLIELLVISRAVASCAYCCRCSPK